MTSACPAADRDTIRDLITAAREMRRACWEHALAHRDGPVPGYGELAKDDKAALKRFEALAERVLEGVRGED